MSGPAILPKGLIVYHSTIHDFRPQDINTPCWFSILEEQSHLHLCFKHYGHSCGRLITYKLKQDVKVLDLSHDGYLRMFVNANGNHKLAHLMKTSDMYGGYRNYREQAEVMLVNTDSLEFVGEKDIDLNKQVEYVEKPEGWRMIDRSETAGNTKCCLRLRPRKPKENRIVPM